MGTWILLIIAGCSTVHGIKPVGKGAIVAEGSLGGPITELYGAPIPLPLSTLGATYGLTDRVDVHAAAHTTAILALNIVAADAGASYMFLDQDGAVPRVMGDLTLVGAFGDNEPGEPAGGLRGFVQPTVSASWDWGKLRRQTVYGALGAFIEPKPGPHLLSYIGVGNLWGVGDRLQLVSELKWISPYASSFDLAPVYYSPGSLGAVSLQLGARFRFGGVQ